MIPRIKKWMLIMICALLCFPLLQAQVQRITIGGKVTATDGEPIACAQLWIRYNGDTLFTAFSDDNGSYLLQGQAYGNIHKVDILWEAEGYEPLSFPNFETYRLTSLLDFDMKRKPRSNEFFERRVCYFNYRCCGVPTPRYPNFFKSYPGHMFRAPWGTFAYIKQKEPVVYYPKITQQITVLDANGQPIQNARVDVKVPDDEARWGFTDENGKLTLYMDFSRGARFATISLYAQGYEPLKRRHQELDIHTQSVYRLHKPI